MKSSEALEGKSGAGGGSRTHTALRPTDFESAASAIPPLRRVLDSTRHAPPAKALRGGRSVSKLRITRRRRRFHARGGPSRNPMSTVPKDASDANAETPTGD